MTTTTVDPFAGTLGVFKRPHHKATPVRQLAPKPARLPRTFRSDRDLDLLDSMRDLMAAPKGR